MAFKITVLDKFSERKLLKIRYSTGIKAQLVIKQRCQVRWQQHVADTEGWCQRFGEGVDIDNLFFGINALQWRNRLAEQAEFAVVIIFDDITAAFFCCPAQQFVAPADGHDDTCRELMRRADVQNIGTAVFQNIGADTLGIHRQITAENIVGLISCCQLRIAGVFQCVDVTASQKLYDKVIQRLRACADDNLLGRNVQTAELVKMSGERLTQRQNAAGAGVADEGVFVRSCERVAQKACPDVIGKGVRRHAAFGEADAWCICLWLKCRCCLALCFYRQRLLLNARHVVTALGLRIDVAFDNELGVGIFHGDEADA